MVEEHGARTSLWHKHHGTWKSLTWEEYGRMVREVGNALLAEGIEPGDKVSILSQTRVEWVVADMAVMCSGCVTVPVYHSNIEDQVRYIVKHSDSRLVFAEDQEQLDKMLEIRGDLQLDVKVVVFDRFAPAELPGVSTMQQFMEAGRRHGRENPGAWEARADAVSPQDVVSFIYTSGTTGAPKAAMINSANVVSIIRHLGRLLDVDKEDMTIAYLPLAHIAERVVGHFMKLSTGNQTVFAESIDDLVPNLRQTGPTVMFGTPRIFEKFYARLATGIKDATRFQQIVHGWALKVGKVMSDCRIEGRRPSPWLWCGDVVARFLIFRKIHDLFGGEIRFMLSGGAPISPEIIRFFHWVGVDIYEVYGMTETTGLISMNHPDGNMIGSVGRLFPGTRVKIEEDGEICASGPQMCVGYYKNEEATRELLETDAEGVSWLHTGDVGHLDRDGYLFITDRKKDLIITAGGKNVAPQNIENLLKTSPYVSQAMVYGDGKPYLTTLITLDEDEIAKFARDLQILYQDLADLSRKKEVVDLIGGVVREKNRQLASYESIKKFRILEEDFDQDKDEVTPTLKVKRKIVIQRYEDLLEGMYRL